ncbi:MAG: tetratricopeptide repeat protein, partial [Candidatus Hermodarchaeota archaeon]
MSPIKDKISFYNKNTPIVPRVGIIWDYENESLTGTLDEDLLTQVLDIAKKEGDLVSTQVYANWREQPEHIEQLFERFGFELVHLRAVVTRLFSTFITKVTSLYVDFHIKTFIVIGGDLGKPPLYDHLAMLGARVIKITYCTEKKELLTNLIKPLDPLEKENDQEDKKREIPLDPRRKDMLQVFSTGLSLRIQGRLDDALEYLQRSLELSEELGSIQDQASCLHHIGIVFEGLGQTDEALE